MKLTPGLQTELHTNTHTHIKYTKENESCWNTRLKDQTKTCMKKNKKNKMCINTKITRQVLLRLQDLGPKLFFFCSLQAPSPNQPWWPSGLSRQQCSHTVEGWRPRFESPLEILILKPGGHFSLFTCLLYPNRHACSCQLENFLLSTHASTFFANNFVKMATGL